MLSKIFITLGIFCLIIGLLLQYKVPLFRLPGDIIIKKGNFIFYFPIITGLILSILLTLILNLLLKK